MPAIPPLSNCTSYLAGHTVHWIQALRTANRPEIAALTRTGTLTSIEGHKLSVVFDDRAEEFFNHEPERVLAVAGRLPCAVTFNDDYALMRVGSYCFSVRPAHRGPLGPCPTDELTNTTLQALAERLRTHGGITLRVPGRPRHPAKRRSLTRVVSRMRRRR